MNITSLNHSLYRTPAGLDTVGGRTPSNRSRPAPQATSIPYEVWEADGVGRSVEHPDAASPVGDPLSHEARLSRLPNNRLSELQALLTYNGTAVGVTMSRGGTIDLYA